METFVKKGEKMTDRQKQPYADTVGLSLIHTCGPFFLHVLPPSYQMSEGSSADLMPESTWDSWSDFKTCKHAIRQKKSNKEMKRKKEVLFGSLKSEIDESQKQHVWKEVTAAVNSVGVDDGSPADV